MEIRPRKFSEADLARYSDLVRADRIIDKLHELVAFVKQNQKNSGHLDLEWRRITNPPELTPEMARRNRENGGLFGPVANACGISFDSLKRMLRRSQEKRPDTIKRCARSLLILGCLDPDRDLDLPKPAPVLPTLDNADLRERYAALNDAISRWPGFRSQTAGTASARGELLAAVDELRAAARNTEDEFIVADACVVAETMIHLRSSVGGMEDKLAALCAAKCREVSKRSADAALRNAASLCRARLIRELIAGRPDAPAKQYVEAAESASEIRQSLEAPIELLLPGVHTDMREKDIKTKRHGYGITRMVPRSYRYQCSFAIDAAYHQSRSNDPNSRDMVQTMLRLALEAAQAARTVRWDNRLQELRFYTLGVMARWMEMEVRSSDTDYTVTKEAVKLMRDLDRSVEAFNDMSTSGDIDARYSLCHVLSIQTLAERPGMARFERVDRILALLADCHRHRPPLRAVSFQEAPSHALFLRHPDAEFRQAFFRACDVSPSESDRILASLNGKPSKTQRRKPH